MKYKSEAYTYLLISSKNLDLEEISGLIQITPTEAGVNRYGEKYYKYEIKAKDALEGLEEALTNLMETFSPRLKEIRSYSLKNDLYVKVFVVIKSKNKEDTGVVLNRDFISFLQEIGAKIEIDTYCE